jgi:hypothetical protein
MKSVAILEVIKKTENKLPKCLWQVHKVILPNFLAITSFPLSLVDQETDWIKLLSIVCFERVWGGVETW